MTKTKRVKREPAPPAVPVPDPKIAELEAKLAEALKKKSPIEQFLVGDLSLTAKLAAAALLVSSALYLFGFLRPVVETGAMPWPSRTEVVDLAKSTDEKLGPVKAGLDATLEVAKQALTVAQQNAQETKTNRIQRLIGLQLQLEQVSNMDPNNLTLKGLLEQTKDQLASLRAEVFQSQQQQQAPPAPSK